MLRRVDLERTLVGLAMRLYPLVLWFCFVVVVVVVVVVVWCCCFCCVAVGVAAAEESVGAARLSGQIFVWYRLRWMRIAWFAGGSSCKRDRSSMELYAGRITGTRTTG